MGVPFRHSHFHTISIKKISRKRKKHMPAASVILEFVPNIVNGLVHIHNIR